MSIFIHITTTEDLYKKYFVIYLQISKDFIKSKWLCLFKYNYLKYILKVFRIQIFYKGEIYEKTK